MELDPASKILGKKVVEGMKEESTATSHYTSTSHYTTRSWGFYDATTNTVAEQIEPWLYLCNANGKLQLAKVETEKDGSGKLERVQRRYISVDGRQFDLPLRIWKVRDYYHVPTIQRCEEFVRGTWKPRPLMEILNDVQYRVSILFDFTFKKDLELWKLFIVQTWLKPILHEFYFFGVDATKGGGKTTLLEIMKYLCRHGYLGGDVSAASLPRLVEELDLALFLDEIDQRLGDGEDDSVSILRKGQRRGNKYVRMNKHTMIPEQFDVAGAHAFTYRSEVEDAFMSRSVAGHTATSRDSKLPVLNVFKDTLLQDLQEELFFWYMQNIPALASSLLHVTTSLSSGVVTCSDCSKEYGHKDIQTKRFALYELLLQQYTAQERAVLDTLIGRNAELGFLLIQECRLVGLELAPIIKDTLEEKQRDEQAGSTFHLDLLRELLAEVYRRVAQTSLVDRWQLNDGVNAGCFYTTKSGVYSEFCQRCKEQNAPLIGTKRYASLLRDTGFMHGVSITSQRPPGRSPTQCLVFTPEILERLSIDGSLKSKILEHLRNAGRYVKRDELERTFQGENIDAELKRLMESGDVYEPRPGMLGVLP